MDKVPTISRMLPITRRALPGLFITGTDTGIGKTVITAGIANWFTRRGARVAASKPVATGCVSRREGLVSEDAEFIAAGGDVRFALDVICPQRFSEPLAPAIAAQRQQCELDWAEVDRSLAQQCAAADVLLVEGVGGVMVPLDRQHTVLDLAKWLDLPAVVVARPDLGTINHTLLTVAALRSAGVSVAGVVINAYPAEAASVAEETNPRMIEQWGKVPVLCIVPRATGRLRPQLTPDIHAALDLVDWAMLADRRR